MVVEAPPGEAGCCHAAAKNGGTASEFTTAYFRRFPYSASGLWFLNDLLNFTTKSAWRGNLAMLTCSPHNAAQFFGVGRIANLTYVLLCYPLIGRSIAFGVDKESPDLGEDYGSV